MFLQEAEHKIVIETVDFRREGKNILGKPEMDDIKNSNFCYAEQPTGIFSVDMTDIPVSHLNSSSAN